MTNLKGKTLTLHHGTGMFYTGPPTCGYKCVLRTGFPSLTDDLSVAEFFANGSRDGRIYSLDVPLDKILDATEEARQLVKRQRWHEIANLVVDAANTSQYWAVAITDITFGNDGPEFRLVQQPPEEAWRVGPSMLCAMTYREHDQVIERFRSGQTLSDEELKKAIAILREDMELDRDVASVMEEMEDERGPDPSLPALLDRMDRDRDLLAALEGLQLRLLSIF